jgi:hypothetical protein
LRNGACAIPRAIAMVKKRRHEDIDPLARQFSYIPGRPAANGAGKQLSHSTLKPSGVGRGLLRSPPRHRQVQCCSFFVCGV